MIKNLLTDSYITILNHVSNSLPSDALSRRLRAGWWKLVGARIGQNVRLMEGTRILGLNFSIGDHSFINRNCYFDLTGSITIGQHVVLGHGVTLITSRHAMGDAQQRGSSDITPDPITIEDGAWLQANVTILPGVTIGAGAVVATGAVVTESVPPNTFVGGVPARPIKTLPLEAPEKPATAAATKQILKVLVISHSAVVDVNQQVYLELAQQPGVAVQLLVPARWKSEFDHRPTITKRLPDSTVPTYLMPVVFRGNNSLHFYRRLPLKEIKAFGPDVIFLHQEPWSLVALQATLLSVWLGCRLTFFTNLNFLKYHPAPFSWITRLTFRRARQAFALSDEVEAILRQKGYRGRISRWWFAIDQSLFYPQPRPTALQTELGLTGHTVIGYVGRLVAEKGLEVLLKAVAELEQYPEIDLPKWKVLIVGDGDQAASLRQLSHSLGLDQQVIFTGVVPHAEVGQYMNCLDWFVLPSLTTPHWKEQFGRVIIESLACGVPVIGSDSGEIPHLLRATGGGLVVPEGNVARLAETLLETLSHPELQRELGQHGRAVVARDYTNGGLAARLAMVLKEETAG